MRHRYIRGILALIWLAAALISGAKGNLAWCGLSALIGIAFGCSVYTSWKKDNGKKGDDRP